MAEGGEDEGATARYLLDELTDAIFEEDLRDYFSALGVIDEITLRTLEKSGKIVGSVKFASPTFELRNIMLKEKHIIKGVQLKIETHKMRKMQKPGYQESQAYKSSLKYSKGGKGEAAGKDSGKGGKGKDSGKGGSWGGKDGMGGGLLGKGACWGGKDSGWGGKGDDWGYGGYGTGYGGAGGGAKGAYGKAGSWDSPAAWGKGKGWDSPYGWDSYGWGPASYGGYDAWGGPWAPPRYAGPYGMGPSAKGGGMKGCSMGSDQGEGKGKAKGKGKDGKRFYEDEGVTARFLMIDMPKDISEEDLREYFGTFGELEDVSAKQLDDRRAMGSVKFQHPTRELRHIMLDQEHYIRDTLLTVQTWKMQKLNRPGAGKGKGSKGADSESQAIEDGSSVGDESGEVELW
mmetsp:Transcript_3048/g.5254  ORF Transcript_3048/g.5254 Transcript_3048/m.5254 type:complete len:401 (+) Transcript_3048:98-1300(+)